MRFNKTVGIALLAIGVGAIACVAKSKKKNETDRSELSKKILSAVKEEAGLNGKTLEEEELDEVLAIVWWHLNQIEGYISEEEANEEIRLSIEELQSKKQVN